MRRIFTLSMALVCLTAISNKGFSQTASCTQITTTGTASNYRVLPLGTVTVPSGTSYPVTSDIYYYNQPKSTINFYISVGTASQGNGTASITPVVTIKWGAGATAQSFTCNNITTVNLTSSNSIPYYISITPDVSLPASTNFQISVALNVTGNKDAIVTAFAMDNTAIPAPAGAALPVHFGGVSVRKATEGALVSWSVGTEQNVSGYDVEKSVDGRSFTKIGFVAAAGQSAYSFADAKAGVVNFYRVKSVDVDGKFGYSTVVALNNGAASVVVKAFMSDKSTLTVQHDAAQAGSRISVISMDGRVVKVQLPAAGAQQTKVDLSNAQTGLYIIRYDNGQGGSESIKVAK